VSINAGGAAPSPWRWFQGIMHWNLVRQSPFLPLQNLLVASKLHHDSLFNSYCLLLVRINVLKHFDSIVSTSVSVSFETVMVLPLGSGSGSSISLRTLCFRISSVSSSISFWSWQFSNLQTSTELYPWVCVLGLIYWVWEPTT
jgi:hypothetical protein